MRDVSASTSALPAPQNARDGGGPKEGTPGWKQVLKERLKASCLPKARQRQGVTGMVPNCYRTLLNRPLSSLCQEMQCGKDHFNSLTPREDGLKPCCSPSFPQEHTRPRARRGTCPKVSLGAGWEHHH